VVELPAGDGWHPDPGEALHFAAAPAEKVGMKGMGTIPAAQGEPAHSILGHQAVGDSLFHEGLQRPVDTHPVEALPTGPLENIPMSQGLKSL